MPQKRTRAGAKKATAPPTTTKVSTAHRTARTRATRIVLSDEDVTGGLVKTSKAVPMRQSGHEQDVFVVGALASPDMTAREALKAGGNRISTRGIGLADKKRPAKTPRAALSPQPQVIMRRILEPARAGEVDEKNQGSTGKRRTAVLQEEAAVSVRLVTGDAASALNRAASRPPSRMGANIQSTPLADTSYAALANFRRRPRQPSLLHALANPTPDETSLTFETTSLEETGEEETTNVSIPFAPHDEGTPLPGVYAATQRQQAALQLPTNDNDDLYTLSPQPKRGKKRKSDAITQDITLSEHNPSPDHSTHASKRRLSRFESAAETIEVPASQPISLPRGAAERPSTSPLSALPSSPPSSARERASRSSTPRRPEHDDSIDADPLSSSPPPPSPSPSKIMVAHPTARRLQQQRGRTAGRTGQSAGQTEPTSAMLRALLPKRRALQTAYDVSFDDSGSRSDDDADADKDSDMEGRTRRPPGRSTAKAGVGRKVLAELKGRKNERLGSSAAAADGKARGKPERAKAGKAKAKVKGNAGAGGKENAGNRVKVTRYGRSAAAMNMAVGSSSPLSSANGERFGDAGLSAELKAARDKFRRIDQGELEFESASLTGGSSPWR